MWPVFLQRFNSTVKKLYHEKKRIVFTILSTNQCMVSLKIERLNDEIKGFTSSSKDGVSKRMRQKYGRKQRPGIKTGSRQ